MNHRDTESAAQPLAATKRHFHHEGTKDTKKKDRGPGHHALVLMAWGGPSLAVAGNYSLTTNGHELTLMRVNFVCLITPR